MQIVIELSDETYKDIKEENSIYGINNGLSARITGKVVGAIQNGMPLPKGHGGLFDAYEIIKQANNMADELDNNFTIADIEKVGTLLESISPIIIIEADKESKEEE